MVDAFNNSLEGTIIFLVMAEHTDREHGDGTHRVMETGQLIAEGFRQEISSRSKELPNLHHVHVASLGCFLGMHVLGAHKGHQGSILQWMPHPPAYC